MVFFAVLGYGYYNKQPSATPVQAASPLSSSVDKLSVDPAAATSFAASVADKADLPVASNVANLSISLSAKDALAQTDNTSLAKPQISQLTATNQRLISSYKTVAGDTVTELAAKFHVSPNTIRWANNLSSDVLEPGKTLRIPHDDGVIHTVKSGDSVTKLANEFSASSERIVLYNDLDLGANLKAGQSIFIPNGNLPGTSSTSTVPNATSTNVSQPILASADNNASASVGNRYAFGYCTWYVYNRRAAIGEPIGSFWGDATSWAYFAQQAGFRVDSNPSPGAVMQLSGGWGGAGHVAFVESVSGGYVNISEMNYSGWDVVSTRHIPLSKARSNYRFIH